MNAKIEKIEDLGVLQNAIALSIHIYNKFQNCKDHSLKDQICRASVSVTSNITEGFEGSLTMSSFNFCSFLKAKKVKY